MGFIIQTQSGDGNFEDKTDGTFEKGDIRFNYRVVGIVFNNIHVLLHRAEEDNFWALPGGRVELLEPSKDALKREMQEELGVEVCVDRLIWIVETFFKNGGTLFHEMGLYYLVELPKDCSLYKKRRFWGKEHLEEEKEIRLIFKWFSLDELETLPLYPKFLRKALRDLPQTTQHIEVWENLKKRSKSI